MLVGARPPEKTAAAPFVYGRFRLPTGGSCDRRITAAGQHVSDSWTRSQTMKRKPPEQARNARGNMSALGDSTPLSAGCVRGDSASDSASEATTSGRTCLISLIGRPFEVPRTRQIDHQTIREQVFESPKRSSRAPLFRLFFSGNGRFCCACVYAYRFLLSVLREMLSYGFL